MRVFAHANFLMTAVARAAEPLEPSFLHAASCLLVLMPAICAYAIVGIGMVVIGNRERGGLAFANKVTFYSIANPVVSRLRDPVWTRTNLA
jgi:hypothetical protein